jgi:hypothetical protein
VRHPHKAIFVDSVVLAVAPVAEVPVAVAEEVPMLKVVLAEMWMLLVVVVVVVVVVAAVVLAEVEADQLLLLLWTLMGTLSTCTNLCPGISIQ